MIRKLQLTEPVRLYLYGITMAALLLLVAYGIVSATMAPLWGGLAVAILAVPATEAARSRVTSPATLARIDTPTQLYGTPDHE